MSLPVCKKCPFCDKKNFLCTEIDGAMSCPLCENYNTTVVYKENNCSHFFCEICKILFRNDKSLVHHDFMDGKIYCCDLINKYKLPQTSSSYHWIESMPQFASLAACSSLIKEQNIEFNWTHIREQNECCVCLRENNVLTSCGHSVCPECKNQLKSNSCPMCRKKIFTELDDCDVAPEQLSANLDWFYSNNGDY